MITIRGEQPIEPAHFNKMADDLFAGDHFAPDMSQLVDLRGCQFGMPASAIVRLGRYLARNYSKQITGPVAVVIEESLAPQTTAVLYRLTAAVRGAEMFEDYGFAVRWLLRRSAKI